MITGLFKRLWCQHTSLRLRTFISNDDCGPLVERKWTCTNCGRNVLSPYPIDGSVTLQLLERASNLKQGERVELV